MTSADIDASSTWEVNDHLTSTSYHKVQITNKKKEINVSGWISYWKHHTGLKVPSCCPGNKVDVNKSTAEQQVCHEIDSGKVVGAHVRIKDADKNVRFAIVPACKKCNNWENEVRPSREYLSPPPIPPYKFACSLSLLPSSDPILPAAPPCLAVQGSDSRRQQQV